MIVLSWRYGLIRRLETARRRVLRPQHGTSLLGHRSGQGQRKPTVCARKTTCKVPYVLQEEDRVVIVRFGHDADPICMQMDETLANVADPIKNFAVIYLVDITAV